MNKEELIRENQRLKTENLDLKSNIDMLRELDENIRSDFKKLLESNLVLNNHDFPGQTKTLSWTLIFGEIGKLISVYSYKQIEVEVQNLGVLVNKIDCDNHELKNNIKK